MKCVLTRLKSTHSKLRTDVIEGNTEELPKLGNSFYLIAKGLAEGTTRYVSTTPVNKISPDGPNSMIFETKNTTYKLEYYEPKEFN